MAYDPVFEFTVTRASGATTTYRRAGALPDIFCSRDGKIVRLNGVKPSVYNKMPMISYDKTLVGAKYLVADAWMPGWRDDGENIVQINREDPLNIAVNNLEVSANKTRGRPVGSRIYRELDLVEATRILGDVRVTAEEFGVSVEEVCRLVKKWCPDLLVDLQNVPSALR